MLPKISYTVFAIFLALFFIISSPGFSLAENQPEEPSQEQPEQPEPNPDISEGEGEGGGDEAPNPEEGTGENPVEEK